MHAPSYIPQSEYVASFMSEPDPWGSAVAFLNQLRIQSMMSAQNMQNMQTLGMMGGMGMMGGGSCCCLGMAGGIDGMAAGMGGIAMGGNCCGVGNMQGGMGAPLSMQSRMDQTGLNAIPRSLQEASAT